VGGGRWAAGPKGTKGTKGTKGALGILIPGLLNGTSHLYLDTIERCPGLYPAVSYNKT
jgi:hypothetical protein